jgi:hypothetical protein
MAKLITVYWRDIPAQVIARQGRNTAKFPLAERFQVAIDRAAMRAGKGGSEAYLEEWRRESTQCGGDLEAAARARVEELEAAIDDERLAVLVKAKGVDPGRNEEE